MEEVKVIKRLRNKFSHHRWSWTIDANQMRIRNPLWIDYIATSDHYRFKTITTDIWDTKSKTKWGLKGKRKKRYKYYDQSNPWTRHKDKIRFYKDLENEGFKHLPTYTQYGFELEGEE